MTREDTAVVLRIFSCTSYFVSPKGALAWHPRERFPENASDLCETPPGAQIISLQKSMALLGALTRYSQNYGRNSPMNDMAGQHHPRQMHDSYVTGLFITNATTPLRLERHFFAGLSTNVTNFPLNAMTYLSTTTEEATTTTTTTTRLTSPFSISHVKRDCQ